jgi:hypothetical protein
LHLDLFDQPRTSKGALKAARQLSMRGLQASG